MLIAPAVLPMCGVMGGARAGSAWQPRITHILVAGLIQVFAQLFGGVDKAGAGAKELVGIQ